MSTFNEAEYKARAHMDHISWLKSDTVYKKKAIQAAKDLHYSRNVINKLVMAKSDGEVERIMIAAREGKI